MPPTRETVFAGRGPTVPAGAALTTQAAFYVDGSDNLRVSSACSAAGVTVIVAGRVRNDDGTIARFTHTHIPNSNRTLKSNDFPLASGHVLNVTVVAQGATVRSGTCFVIVQLISGLSGATAVLATLVQGYVTTTQHLAWPGSPLSYSLEGMPLRRSFVVANPAANTDWAFGPGGRQRWRIVSVFADLLTGATGLPRTVTLQHGTAVGFASIVGPAANQADLTTRRYLWAPNLPVLASADATVNQQPIPHDLVMMPFEGLGSSTNGIGGGDQWSAIVVTIDEWLDVE